MLKNPIIDSWRLFFLWLLATALSMSCGSGIASLIFAPFRIQDGFVDLSMFAFLLGIVFVGLFLGLAQWLVLRQYLLNAGWWVLATVAGYLIYSIFLILSNQLNQNELAFLWSPLLGLLGLGLLQSVVLRKYVYKAYLWILAPSLLTLITIGVTLLGRQNDSSLPNTPSILVDSLLYGSITGIVLVWLFKRPKPGAVAFDDNPYPVEESSDESVN